MKLFLILLSGLIASCATAQLNPRTEPAMAPGMTIDATTNEGRMTVSYAGPYVREYSWEGHNKTFKHQAREKRWNGSMGMYRPQGDGSMHAILEEGQQHFQTMAEASAWMAKQQRSMDYVWNEDGLALGWKQQARPGDGFLALHVNVWQIFVAGKRAGIPGASPSRIQVRTENKE